MKSGKPHRAIAIGLVVCSSVATFYVNTSAIHVKEPYNPLQPATIETSVPETTAYVDPSAAAMSKASAPNGKIKKPPVTTVAPVITIAPTTTIDRDRDRDKDDDDREKDD